jgi:hypothetical protein
MGFALALFEIIAIILICIVAYYIGAPAIAARVQGIYWGPMINAAYPILLTMFAFVFAVLLIDKAPRSITK